MDIVQGNRSTHILQYTNVGSVDQLTDWAAHFLGGEDHAAIAPYALQAYRLISMIRAWTLPLLDSLVRKPDLATIALLLIIILISLKLLNMLVQSLLFWFRMFRSVAFWGGLATLALWMWTRGPEGVFEDISHWTEVWNREYGYWKEKERLASTMKGFDPRNTQRTNFRQQRQEQRGWF